MERLEQLDGEEHSISNKNKGGGVGVIDTHTSMATNAEELQSNLGKSRTDEQYRQASPLPSVPMIHIESLSFAYDVVPVYDDLNLSIQKGEQVAIVGPSGSGKSTLFALLQRWYDYRGTISIAGADTRTLSEDTLQSYMAYATQDIYVFHATIGDNIRLAKPSATDEEIWQALEAVQLADWGRTLPKGLRTMVGQGGMGLSGGQQQRLGMARLYLRDAEILLLDEPLEGLDQVTRHLVQEQLRTLFQGKTVLYITHHIGQLHEMDRILFLEQGRIVESGTYESLLALQGRFYEYHRLSMERI